MRYVTACVGAPLHPTATHPFEPDWTMQSISAATHSEAGMCEDDRKLVPVCIHYHDKFKAGCELVNPAEYKQLEIFRLSGTLRRLPQSYIDVPESGEEKRELHMTQPVATASRAADFFFFFSPPYPLPPTSTL